MHLGQETRGTVAEGPRETRFIDISRDPRLVVTSREGRS